MAVSAVQTQVTWGGANSQSVSSGGNSTSDAVTIDGTAIGADLQVKVDRTGTAVSGDVTTIKILYTHGDPDAAPDVADEYDTQAHALPNTVDNFSEDPGIITIPLKVASKGFKVYVSNAGAGAVVVACQMVEKRVS